ncbi:MAG: hypothetical protein PHE27_03890 [Alphaproteobacteria bacterium]|nr:hypothetical protein [Alphaproteobacteria bacterium]
MNGSIVNEEPSAETVVAEDEEKTTSSGKKENKNRQVIEDFKAATASIVKRLETLSLDPDAHFVVEKYPLLEHDTHQDMYVVKMYNPYDKSGARARESFGIVARFYASGQVEVCKYYNENETLHLPFLKNSPLVLNREEERLYKASLRKYALGSFGIGKVKPEKLDRLEDAIFSSVRKGLIANGLVSLPRQSTPL